MSAKENHELIKRPEKSKKRQKTKIDVYEGIMRIWAALSVLWILFWIIASIAVSTESGHGLRGLFISLTFAVVVPLVGYLIAKLLCWVIRGFAGRE